MVTIVRRTLLAGAALAVLFATGAVADDKPTMGIVVKIGGIPWFNAMESGIKEEGAKVSVPACVSSCAATAPINNCGAAMPSYA